MNLTKPIYVLVILFLLTGIRAGYAFDAVCTSVQTIDTSQFSPPSPDAAGIAYLRAPGSGNLMISDSEVEETMQGITLYQGVNMFEVTPGGSQVDTWDTTTLSNPSPPPLSNPPPCNYSNEPTGVAYNPDTDRLFITDDNKDDVYEITRGPDGFFGTAPTGTCDDAVTTYDTAGFGATDPEGVGYGAGAVWIADGASNEVYKIALGANQVLGGGDDGITHFDTGALGIIDEEGIDYDPVSGHLFLATTTQDETLYEVTPQGTLVRTIGVQPVPKPKKLAGVAVGPTDGQGNLEVYLADRGVDNDSDPTENDGKVYKCIVPPLPAGNQPPTVSAGVDQAINLPNPANLNGTVSDDGQPPPPAQLTTTWSQISGPSTPNGVTFGNASAVDTTASFPGGQGTYVLRLTAGDSALTASDDVTITVNPAPSVSTVFLSLAASSGTVGGVSFRDEDILKFDGTWSMYFDGSDVGVTGEIDALVVRPGGTILLSLAAPATLANVGAVDDSDIVEFTPTSTGVNTAGMFTLFFRGLGAGLDTDAEDIDAIGFTTPNGALVVSTTGSPSVTCGPPACPSLRDEDLLVYTGAALGEGTTNSWNIYFDGSDVDLSQSSSEDVNGTEIDGMNGDIYLTTTGVFSVPGVSGDGVDIFVCAPGSTGGTTSCAYRSFFDGSANGLTGDVDGFDL